MKVAKEDGEVRSVALSPDGKTVAAGVRYGAVTMWDISSGRMRLHVPVHSGDVWALAFSPDGKILVSGDGGWNRASPVKVWDSTTGDPRGELANSGETLSLAFSPDGEYLAAGSGDRTARVWHAPK